MALDDDDRAVQREAFRAGNDELLQNLTGKSHADILSDTMRDSPRSMLQHLYPSGDTKSGIDTRTAARRLGVSQRTVQRWARYDRIPRDEPLKKLRTKTRQTVTTKRGRAQMAKRVRQTAPATGKNKIITVHGLQGPTDNPQSTGSDRPRFGNANLSMTPDQQAALYESWAGGGDEAAQEYLTSLFDGGYVDGWRFHGIDGISWKDAP
ncbi:MAG: hypothetical protein ACTHX2_01685 [Microbacterium sp.]